MLLVFHQQKVNPVKKRGGWRKGKRKSKEGQQNRKDRKCIPSLLPLHDQLHAGNIHLAPDQAEPQKRKVGEKLILFEKWNNGTKVYGANFIHIRRVEKVQGVHIGVKLVLI